MRTKKSTPLPGLDITDIIALEMARTDKPKTVNRILVKESILYSLDEVCPSCGRYTPEGGLCIPCQKEYDLYKPKITYVDF